MIFFKKPVPEIPKHRWFAWYPVFAWRNSSGYYADIGIVWLEYVMRSRRTDGSWKYEVIE